MDGMHKIVIASQHAQLGSCRLNPRANWLSVFALTLKARYAATLQGIFQRVSHLDIKGLSLRWEGRTDGWRAPDSL